MPNVTVEAFIDTLMQAANTQAARDAIEAMGKSVAESFTRQKWFPTATLVDAANIAWNLDTGQVARVTLAGNRTINNPTNMNDGGQYTLFIVQDATGSRTVTWGSAYKWAEGFAPVLSTAPNAIDMVTFISDGTNMYGAAQYDFS